MVKTMLFRPLMCDALNVIGSSSAINMFAYRCGAMAMHFFGATLIILLFCAMKRYYARGHERSASEIYRRILEMTDSYFIDESANIIRDYVNNNRRHKIAASAFRASERR